MHAFSERDLPLFATQSQVCTRDQVLNLAPMQARESVFEDGLRTSGNNERDSVLDFANLFSSDIQRDGMRISFCSLISTDKIFFPYKLNPFFYFRTDKK